jgi:hypothetical protein
MLEAQRDSSITAIKVICGREPNENDKDFSLSGKLISISPYNNLVTKAIIYVAEYSDQQTCIKFELKKSERTDGSIISITCGSVKLQQHAKKCFKTTDEILKRDKGTDIIAALAESKQIRESRASTVKKEGVAIAPLATMPKIITAGGFGGDNVHRTPLASAAMAVASSAEKPVVHSSHHSPPAPSADLNRTGR